MPVEFEDHGLLAFTPTDRHDTYPAIDPTKADLSGKVVLVTGASKGIGRAYAVAVAQAGASGLVLLARSDLASTKEACLAAKRVGKSLEVLTFSVDVADNAQVVAAIQKAEEVFGRLDVVVNNAGKGSQLKPLIDSDVDDWWGLWDINLRGAYHVTRAALPLLIKSTNGSKTVINISSLAAGIVAPGLSSYAISKLAISRFAEFVNTEYGDQGVLAYSVHPGSIITDMSSGVPDDMKYLFTETLELAAHTLVWLIKERREWLAGRWVSSTWDVEELEGKKDEIVKGDKLKARIIV